MKNMSHTQPVKVSILIPVYNAAATLIKTLSSILAQDIDEWEAICVNDASTDSSLKIIQDFAARDSRFKVVGLSERHGTNCARKEAIKAASGEYIMFLDADDLYFPHTCRLAYEKAVQYSADIFYFDTETEFADTVSEDIKFHITHFFKFSGGNFLHGSKNILKAIYVDRFYTWNVWNKIYKSDLLKSAVGYITDKNVLFAEDYYSTFIVSALAKNMLAENIPLYRYRCGHGISTANSAKKRLEAMISAYSLKDDLIKFCNSREELRADEDLKDCVRNYFEETLRKTADSCQDTEFYDLLNSLLATPNERKLLDMFFNRYRDIKKWEDDCKKARKEYSELESGYKKLENGYNELVLKYDSVNDNCAELKDEYRRLNSDYKDLSSKHESVNSAYLTLKDDFRRVDNNYKDLLSEHDSVKNSYSDLKDDFRRLEKEHKELSFAHDSSLRSYAVLQEDCTRLDRNFKELASKHSKIREDYSGLESGYKKLESGYNALAADHNALKTAFSTLQDEHKQLETEHKELSSAYDTANEHRSNLMRTGEELRIKYDTLLGENSQLEDKYSCLEKEYSAVNNKFSAMKTNCVQLEEKLADLRNEYGVLKERYYNVCHEYDTLKDKNRQLADKHHGIVAERGKLVIEHIRYASQNHKILTELFNMQARQKRSEEIMYWHTPYPIFKLPLLSLLKLGRLTRLKLRAKFSNRRKFETMLLSDTGYLDSQWYLKQNPDLASSGVDAVQHYLEHGWKEGRNPSPYFSTDHYLSQVPELVEKNVNPLIHYLCQGILMDIKCVDCECGNPRPETLLPFDEKYYNSQFSSQEQPKDPVCHYCEHGWRNGLNPSADFNGSIYLANNPDILAAGINPLEHYLLYGKKDGRSCTNVYQKALPDMYDVLKNSGLFDADYYRSAYLAGNRAIDPLWHYILCGWQQGNNPSPAFWTRGYLQIYMDIAHIQLPALYHYLKWGRYEGRERIPLHPETKEFIPEKTDRKKLSSCSRKVLLAVHQLDVSGVPALACNIAEALAGKRGAAIISPFDGEYKDVCLKRNVPVFVDPAFFISPERLEYYKANGFSSCIFLTIGVAGAFVIHAQSIPSLMWINDNMTAEDMPQKMCDILSQQSNFYAASELTRSCVATYAGKVEVLPYPVKDVSQNEKRVFTAEKIHFAVLGRLEKRKAQDLAIEAFLSLPQEIRSKAELQIIGSTIHPEFRAKLKKLAGSEKNIIFRDGTADSSIYHGYFKDIDVLICPSRNDPMPLVAVDALMHGCPAIVSSRVGQSEYIRKEQSGLVFDSEDAVQLAKCMEKMITEREKLAELSENARRTFLTHFEYQKAVAAIEKALQAAEKNWLEKQGGTK